MAHFTSSVSIGVAQVRADIAVLRWSQETGCMVRE
jgi:hypothetical protein